MSDFKGFAQAALERAGIPIGDGDLDVLGVVATVFEPGMTTLDAADLTALPFDGALDPARAPAAS